MKFPRSEAGAAQAGGESIVELDNQLFKFGLFDRKTEDVAIQGYVVTLRPSSLLRTLPQGWRGLDERIGFTLRILTAPIAPLVAFTRGEVPPSIGLKEPFSRPEVTLFVINPVALPHASVLFIPGSSIFGLSFSVVSKSKDPYRLVFS